MTRVHHPSRRLTVGLFLALAMATVGCSSSTSGGASATTEPLTVGGEPPIATGGGEESTTVPATDAPTTTAPAAVTVDPDGIGEAKLGDDPETVIAYFSSLFGPPISDSGWITGSDIALCHADPLRFVSWPGLYTVYGPWDALGAGVSPVQQFAFFVYGYSDGVLSTPVLASDRGLLPGDSVARLQELYPEVTVYPGSLGGGTFYKSTPDFVLGPNGKIGKLLVTDPEPIVLSLEAGDWPCQDTN